MIFWQNMQKYAQPSWTHFTQNFLNHKRNIDMLKYLQPEKYAKAYFALPYTLENHMIEELGFGKQFLMCRKSDRFRVKLRLQNSGNLMHFQKISNKGPTQMQRL